MKNSDFIKLKQAVTQFYAPEKALELGYMEMGIGCLIIGVVAIILMLFMTPLFGGAIMGGLFLGSRTLRCAIELCFGGKKNRKVLLNQALSFSDGQLLQWDSDNLVQVKKGCEDFTQIMRQRMTDLDVLTNSNFDSTRVSSRRDEFEEILRQTNQYSIYMDEIIAEQQQEQQYAAEEREKLDAALRSGIISRQEYEAGLKSLPDNTSSV